MSFWAALGQVAAPAAMNALGSWLGQGEAGQSGYDVVQMPQYDWTESSLQGNNEYLTGLLDALKRGKEPAWMSTYLNQIQGGLHQDAANRFYGSAGRPGTLRDVAGAASVFGVGPQAAMNKTMQATADFMSEGDKIDQYISGLKYNTMQDYSTRIPEMIQNQPRGPESQIVTYGGASIPSQNVFGGLAGSINWESMFKPSGSSVNSQYQNQYGSGYSQGATFSPMSYNFGNNSGVVGIQDDYSKYPVAR